jgi:hypothetical protein
MNYTQEQIIELAKNVEIEDSIDWEEIPNVSKDHVYQIVGSQAYEMYHQWEDDPDELHAILLSTVIKLLVENFVLNIRVNSI